MAGYEPDEAYCLPRSRLQPPEDLLKQIFPFIETQLERFEHYQHIRESDASQHPGFVERRDEHNGSTARCVLSLWRDLRVEDAAALLVLHPDREEHRFFRHSIFRSNVFTVSEKTCFCLFHDLLTLLLFYLQDFKQEMRLHLAQCAGSFASHGSASAFRSLIPGVNERLDVLTQGQKEVSDKIVLLHQTIARDDRLERVLVPLVTRVEADCRRNAQVLREVGRVLSQAADPTDESDFSFFRTTGEKEAVTAAASVDEGAIEQGGTEAMQEVTDVDVDDFTRAKAHNLQFRLPTSVRCLLDEWYGLNLFAGIPIDGGIGRCEELFGKQWRLGWKPSDDRYLSRIRQVVLAVKSKVDSGLDEGAVVHEMDDILQQYTGFSPFVDRLRVDGWFPGSKTRTTTKKKQQCSGSGPLTPEGGGGGIGGSMPGPSLKF
jgi:hypothetical protein